VLRHALVDAGEHAAHLLVALPGAEGVEVDDALVEIDKIVLRDEPPQLLAVAEAAVAILDRRTGHGHPLAVFEGLEGISGRLLADEARIVGDELPSRAKCVLCSCPSKSLIITRTRPLLRKNTSCGTAPGRLREDFFGKCLSSQAPASAAASASERLIIWPRTASICSIALIDR
jgi:hypothetical protein